MFTPSFSIVDMVISKSSTVVHPRPCIKEAMMPIGHTSLYGGGGAATLPRPRLAQRRVAELPSLRCGPVGVGYPVKVARQAQPAVSVTLPRKYTRSFTANVVGDVPAIRATQIRRVRFDLPPCDVSDSPPPPTTFHTVHTTSSRRSRGATINKSTSSTTTTACRREPIQHVTVISSTTSVRERAHPVSTYVRGTLAPTATVAGVQAGQGLPGGALLKAAKEHDEERVKEVLRGGCVREVNAVDSSGRTAISYIASNGSVDILEAMLQLPGIDPNLPDNEGNTPLHFAAQAGQVECLNFLLSRCQGLEIDARNHLGFTPLMKAALQGRNKCAKLLLFAGANPTLRDTGRGLRAEQWARYCGRYVCADVIEKFARHRLLERSTSCGRWGSDTDIGATRLVLGKVVPIPQGHVTNQSQGIKSKLRKVFRTSSGPSNSDITSSSARLVTQLTSAALCASSPVLPASQSVPTVVKSLIRPLTVPRLQITLANGTANVTSDLSSLSMLLEQDTTIDKPPRMKKKMK